MDWSRVDYCDVLSDVWTLILTAPIHCRGPTGEQVMQCYISPNTMKKVKWHVTCDQVWWPTLRIRALHLTHPKCTHTHTHTHTHSSEHTHSAVNTHTPWTHTWSSGKPFMLQRRGAVGGSVPAQGHLSRGIEGGESTVHSHPPTYNPCQMETWTWETNSSKFWIT